MAKLKVVKIWQTTKIGKPWLHKKWLNFGDFKKNG
jgi:hypothetical protein